MSLWDLNTPPQFKNPKGKPLVATARGYEDPDTGEVLVAISNLIDKAGAADVLEVSFLASSYLQGAPLSVKVRFNERVDVTVGASLEVSWSGTGGNFFINAAAQSNTHEVIFDKQADNSTPQVVPSEPGDLSVASQSITGTIKDAGTLVNSNLAISAAAAFAAGVITVS